MSHPLIEGFRLSPPQRHVWLRQGDEVGPYRVCAIVSVTGAIDPSRIEAALRSLVERHEILRTTYRQLSGMTMPMQVIESDHGWSLDHEDVRALGREEQAAAVDARFRALAECPMDLDRGPVWRAHLLVQSATEAKLVVMWPSLVADVASVRIIVEEVARFVDGEVSYDPSGDDLPLQHVEVAEWQHELLEADGTAAGREFWQQIDTDSLMSCRLTLRRPQRRTRGAFVPRSIASGLPRDAMEGVSRWAAAHGRTVQDVLLACWQLLMWRLTERTDLVLGIGSHGRSLGDLERVLGPLTKTLPVRFIVDPHWSFADLVERSCAALQDHVRWQSLFAWNMVDAREEAGPAPFCPLVFDAVDWTPIRSGQATWAIRRADASLDRVDLKLGLALTGAGWQARWTYDEQVHTSDHAACVADQYISVLRTVATMTPPVLAGFDVRGEWERVHGRAISVERYAAVVHRDVCAHQLFEARAAATPDREAVVCDAERLTYGELNARADRIARFLHAQGVGAETRVGLFLEHSPDLLAAAFGILKSGAAFVPLPPGLPAARRAWLVDQVRAPLVLTHKHLAADWPETSDVRLVCLDEDAEAIAAAPAMSGPVRIDSANLAYVLFTSGSTGEPKGVMISHGALANYLTWSHTAYLQDNDVSVPLHSSIGFDATLTSLLLPLCAGARVVVTPDAQGADVISRVVSSPDPFGFLKITPAHLAVIASLAAQDRLSSLADTLVIGGEALDSEQLAAWQAHAPGTRVVNEYGPTEATVGCVVHDTTVRMLDPGPVPIGYPIANVACHVLDAHGHTAPVGVTGELYIGGAQLARGYEGRPDLTAERFVPDPFALDAGARCYRTGDLVRVRVDGSLDYVGRRDQQVKVRGYRVELGEVEAAVRQQAGIRDAVVLLREDVPGERRLVAYVVAAPEAPVTSDRLQQALRVTLPDYMVPAVIVPLDALPMTPNGKVDRRRLPAPAGERPTLAQTYAAPRTRAETILARLWAEVLRLDRVGIHDNFFALGGDSILSLQIVARAAQAGLRLAPRLVFEHQTIEALAAVASETIAAPVDQGAVTGPVPFTPIQHWFFDQPVEDRHHYNQSVALELTQPIEPALLTDAWLRLQIHHDALRLRFRQTDAGWEQTNADADEVTTPIWIDASGVEEGRREALWARVARECQTSLDLAHGPIVRAALVNWGPDTPSRLLIVLHHVVVDGLSWRVLLEDLQHLCGRGTSSAGLVELPPKSTSLKVWSEKLTAFVNSGALDAELPVWIGMSEPGAALGRDRALGANSVASQRTVAISFTVEETEALLHRLPATLDVHVQDALLTGLVTALSHWSGERTWRIDLEGHGREMLGDGDDVSRTVGWFTSVYPVRFTAPEGDDPVTTLRDVRAAVRRVPRHGVGYGALRYLRDGEIAGLLRSAEPPEVIFNYWGQLDQVFSSSAAIRPAHVPAGATRSPRQTRSYVFEVSAGVIDARLQVLWTYSSNLHAQETIERLVAGLRQTVSHVTALPEHTRASLKTPVDFPLADVTQAELDGIVAEGGPVADIYPLSPMQEGMLFHRLYEADESVYGQQFAVRLNGPLDPVAFQEAWEAVVARHDILRTGFFWQRRERPLQVVRERATLPWTFEDWRGLSSDEQEARLVERLRADERRGFTFEQPPLMRIGLVRLQDEQWHVLWTSHHIVLDGWSMPIVVRDVLTAYAAEREHRAAYAAQGQHRAPWTGKPAARYGDYIAWLQRQDAAKAEAFWRHALDGFQTPSLVAGSHALAQAAASVPSRQFLRTQLPGALVEALQQLGTEQHITMNTWCAGAWALLLAHCTRQRDVAFGTVVSGRPADLADAETIPGLFINTLPLRLKVLPGTPAVSWFAECQRRQVEARDYEYSSLARIQNWSAVPAGTPLFDTLFVYENYPVEHAWREQSELRVEQASASVQTNFPLAIEVAGRGSDLGITVAIDTARVSPALGGFIRDGFEAVLSRVLAAPDITVGALLDGLDEFAVGDTRQLRSGRRESLQSLRRAATRSS